MQPPSLHTSFFSSLKQVEKRLRLENPCQSSHLSPPTPPPPALVPPQESNQTLTESLSSPIYLNLDQPNNCSTLQDSEPPGEFLSNSPEFPPTHEGPLQSNGADHPPKISEVDDNAIDNVERLIQLLGLSDCEEKEHVKDKERVRFGFKCDEGGAGDGGSSVCDGGFYAKIVGVKGPKCVKEVERLEGWIKHFSTGGAAGGGGGVGEVEMREPLRLVHLLLGKAAFVSGERGGFEGFEFPSTIEEFLQNDPPTD